MTNKKENANEKYSDIIDLPHHVSSTHAHMSVASRAAQFASFAALSGYEEDIDEATEEFIKDNQ